MRSRPAAAAPPLSEEKREGIRGVIANREAAAPQGLNDTRCAYDAAHGIATEAWSPLARGRFNEAEPIVNIAKKYGKTPAQVVIRWHIELGNLVIPKTANPDRLLENISVFDFSLDGEDMAAIATLENGLRTGPNPEEFN